ncbi:MAG: aspartate aminotransferase [Candidatus Cloacimonadota bacterium]|nr:MAG: aspartate aminotransferase [Candidatus Cloacimonadota bacterium]
MAVKISNRAKSIKPSPTLAISAKAKQMQAKGIDVINFGVGEPDFNTPEYIKEAGIKAIKDNFTRYTANPGIPELRKAICQKLQKDNNLEYDILQILVSPGAKASIFNILMAVCDPKDKVILTAPYWVSYPSQIELADAVPVIIETDEKNGFKMTPEQLEEAVADNPTAKAVLINSPNNPTGTVYTKKELESLSEICLKHGLLIISDEIYEKLIYGNEKHYSVASFSREHFENTVVINGVSKAYAMTGWRLGYAAGPAEIIKRAAMFQSHTTSCVNAMAQKAAVVALNTDTEEIENMRLEFDKRRSFLVEEMNKIPHVECFLPNGAFYAMPNISYYLKNNKAGIKDTVEICTYFLEKYHIAIVPGQAFGVRNYVRFSYANSMENIKEGISRFRQGLADLLKG